MLSTYLDAVSITLHVAAAIAGVLTVLVPAALTAIALRQPAQRLTWRIDAHRNRPS